MEKNYNWIGGYWSIECAFSKNSQYTLGTRAYSIGNTNIKSLGKIFPTFPNMPTTWLKGKEPSNYGPLGEGTWGWENRWWIPLTSGSMPLLQLHI
jgi:hypothetical protein